MANIRGRGRPPKRAKTMDHESVTVTAGVRVLPQEQDSAPSSFPQHIKSWPLREAGKEEEWLPMPVQVQQPQTSEPMKQRRKRGRPRKIISQSLSSSRVVQHDDQKDKAATNRKEQKNSTSGVAATNRKEQKNSTSRVIRTRVAPDPDNTDSSTDEAGADEERRVNPNNIPNIPLTQETQLQPQLQLQLQLQSHEEDPYSCLSSNKNRNMAIARKKKKTNKRKKMNRGGVVDRVLPEIPRRERSSRAAIIRNRVANYDYPLSSSDFGKESDFGKGIFVTTTGLDSNTTVDVDQSSPSSPDQSSPSSPWKLEVPGPIPDFRDLLITDDMVFTLFRDFFQDLP